MQNLRIEAKELFGTEQDDEMHLLTENADKLAAQINIMVYVSQIVIETIESIDKAQPMVLYKMTACYKDLFGVNYGSYP